MGQRLDPPDKCRLFMARPDPVLGPGIIGYRDFRLPPGPPQQRLFGPAGHVSLFVAFDGQMQAWDTRPSASTASKHTMAVHGLHLSPRVLGHGGGMEGVEITFAPWAAHRVFGTSMADLTDTVVEADAVLGRRMQRLADELSEAPPGAARFKVLDRRLLQWTARAPASHAPNYGVLRAWDLLNRTSGNMSVKLLAEHVQWSTRHLEMEFRRQIGISPKRLARVIRINRAIRQLTGGSSPADTALACGYYDQAHLIRDFKALAGTTPGRFQAGLPLDHSKHHAAEGPTRFHDVPRLGQFERHVIPHSDFL